MRILALDVGDKRIGVAVGDTETRLATPLAVYERIGTKRDTDELLRIATRQRAEALLVGLPYALDRSQGDGAQGEQAQRVLRFCEALREKTPLTVLTWDERFTSTEADLRMSEAGVPIAKRKGLRDSAAAAIILQSYLDNGPPTWR